MVPGWRLAQSARERRSGQTIVPQACTASVETVVGTAAGGHSSAQLEAVARDVFAIIDDAFWYRRMARQGVGWLGAARGLDGRCEHAAQVFGGTPGTYCEVKWAWFGLGGSD